MEFNVGMFVVFLMLAASLGVASYVGFLVYRLSKDSQRQSNLMLKALVKSTQDMRSFDTKINLVQETGMQSLTFQKKAFDHNRILVLSMNQQLKSIQKMLDDGSHNSAGKVANKVRENVSLTKGALANNFKTQSPKIARTHVGSTEAVVKLEDLFAHKFVDNSSQTERALRMSTERNAALIRRVVNG
ncbi:MAG: hypothetical protein COC00_010540 [Rhizobiales bacterium]|nr:hypothetical protein [Hyphomicrobiales bacterium]